MTKWLTGWWRRMRNAEATEKAEVEQIAVLQQAAQRRRAEHAEELEQSVREQNALPPSRKRVQEAEAAYAAALQVWNNKQCGFRVR